MSQDQISVTENRKLAKWRPLIKKDGTINYNFGKDYNNWFNDRFFLRKIFLNTTTNLALILTGKVEQGYIDNDFLYFNYEVNHTNLSNISRKDYDAIIAFDKYCKSHNIDLYVLIGPDKGYIYPISKNVLAKDEYDKKIEKEIQRLKNDYGVNIIHPIKELRNGTKNNLMYYKTEHHWTQDSAYIGYEELMREINKKYKDIKAVEKNEYNTYENNLVQGSWIKKFQYGEASRYMNLPISYIKSLHKTKYRYYVHKNSNLLKIKEQNTPYHRNKKFFYPKGANYKVVIIGTSIVDNLSEFLTFTFKDIFYIRNNGVKNIPTDEEYQIIKYYEKDILEYKPDIIILSLNYNRLKDLHNIFVKK